MVQVPETEKQDLTTIYAILALSAVLGLLAVFGNVLLWVYNQVPPWARAYVVQPAVRAADETVTGIVGTTPTDIDDKIWAMIRERLTHDFGLEPIAG